MRLIGELNAEQEAFALYSFFLKEGIPNLYESYTNPETGQRGYRIWIKNEEDLPKARSLFEKFREHPDAPEFQAGKAPPSPDYRTVSQHEGSKLQTRVRASVPPLRISTQKLRHPVMQSVILICLLLFIWNNVQEASIYKKGGMLATELSLTPIQKALFFDVPASYQYIEDLVSTYSLKSYKTVAQLPEGAKKLLTAFRTAPSWRGIYAYFKESKADQEKTHLFEKISKGEIWRFITPVFLHAGFLHILFDMLWVWYLVKQIEERLSVWKIVLLMLAIGIVSNVAQYIATGPFFLGYSAIDVGLAGFIWMRQRVAPWEGYPMHRFVALFLLIFVVAMVFLQIFSFTMHYFHTMQTSPQIANTAHVMGGLTGILLGRFSFFGRTIP